MNAEARWLSDVNPATIVQVLEHLRRRGPTANPKLTIHGQQFEAFGTEDWANILASAIDAPDLGCQRIKQRLVRSALGLAAEKGQLSPRRILSAVNREFQRYRELPVRRFMVLGSISIGKPGLISRRVVDGCIVEVRANDLVEILGATSFNEISRNLRVTPNPLYRAISSRVSARDPIEALEVGISAINFLRGIWNLALTHSFRMSLGPTAPVNVLRLGP